VAKTFVGGALSRLKPSRLFTIWGIYFAPRYATFTQKCGLNVTHFLGIPLGGDEKIMAINSSPYKANRNLLALNAEMYA